jgi:hypothetical protein
MAVYKVDPERYAGDKEDWDCPTCQDTGIYTEWDDENPPHMGHKIDYECGDCNKFGGYSSRDEDGLTPAEADEMTLNRGVSDVSMDRAFIGDQSDNAAEAQALAQTNPGALATPQDRSENPSRQVNPLGQSIQDHSAY